MTVLPVIRRELRVQARQSFTYAMRLLGVVALLAGGFLFADTGVWLPWHGAELFARLHAMLLLAVWILVPLGAADCLSRERREGTLPLLLLTPLKPGGIVLAKSLAHGLRAMTLLLAVLPVLTIPFLMGGVNVRHVVTSAATNCSALGWALAAALAASAVHRSAVRAQAMAMLLSTLGLALFVAATGLAAALASGAAPGRLMEAGLWVLFGGIYWSGNFGPGLPAGSQVWVLVGLMLGLALLVWTAALGWAAWFVRVAGREQPPPEWAQQVERYLCTPVLGAAWLRRWLRRTLERNPIGWLERRTWQGRLVAWSWIAVLISVYTYLLTDSFFGRRVVELQSALGWLLVGSMAAGAAGSFRRERETGVLELLLVSPLQAGEIVSGRLRGIWTQFLPAFVLWAGVWVYLETFVPSRNAFGLIVAFLCRFLMFPVVGLYFSLRCRGFLTAFVLTLAVGAGLLRATAWFPSLLPDGGLEALGESRVWLVFTVLSHGLVAVFTARALVRRLERRAFPLERAL
jgi:ABC-type transport system involved in cytochrome c biogenesis permease component